MAFAFMSTVRLFDLGVNMKNDSGTAISKPIDSMLKLIFVLVIACLSWQVQAACTFFDGFKDNNDGTVTDPRNGLIWKRCTEGFEWNGSACQSSTKTKKMDWFGAMHTAKQSRFLGKADWRIPSRVEFEAVLGNSGDCRNNNQEAGQFSASDAIAHAVLTANDGSKFPGAYWSTSPLVGDSSRVWYAEFTYGDFAATDRSSDKFVRLVRGNQSLGGKASLEFETEYSKLGQYKNVTSSKDVERVKDEKAAAQRWERNRQRLEASERRAKEEQERNKQGLNRIRSREGNVVIGTCASGNDFSAFVDTSNGRWTTAGGRNGMQFASNLDEAVWKVCN